MSGRFNACDRYVFVTIGVELGLAYVSMLVDIRLTNIFMKIRLVGKVIGLFCSNWQEFYCDFILDFNWSISESAEIVWFILYFLLNVIYSFLINPECRYVDIFGWHALCIYKLLHVFSVIGLYYRKRLQCLNFWWNFMCFIIDNLMVLIIICIL